MANEKNLKFVEIIRRKDNNTQLFLSYSNKNNIDLMVSCDLNGLRISNDLSLTRTEARRLIDELQRSLDAK